jgi:hypothetical protein
MKKLDEVVRETVEGFVNNDVLFTALDISNSVKSVLPTARHKEVRDMVRAMFSTDIEPVGWARTPITVTLVDGTQADALLYHPLSASWDLDTEYDKQKRTIYGAPSPQATVTKVTAPTQTVAQVHAKDLWASMFDSQPSLFPRK